MSTPVETIHDLEVLVTDLSEAIATHASMAAAGHPDERVRAARMIADLVRDREVLLSYRTALAVRPHTSEDVLL